MSLDFDTIVAIVEQRRRDDTPLKRQMIEVRDRVNGDVVLPMIDVEGEPSIKSPSPQLIADAIDNTAMRAASTRPTVDFPALDPTVFEGPRSQAYARARRRATYASWHKSQFGLVARKTYRHLTGYGEMSMLVVPDWSRQIPIIQARDPLTTYAEPRSPEDVRAPLNVGYVFGRSANWITKNYGEGNPDLVKLVGKGGEGLWDLLEWIDEDDIVVGIIGPRDTRYSVQGGQTPIRPVELSRWPNRCEGMVPAACGQRVTLDRVASQVANIVGTADLMDRLIALDYLSQERAVFPDRYMISLPGQAPQILTPGGRWVDGRSGDMNLLSNVQQLGSLNDGPSPMVGQMIDRLERAARVSGGNPSMFGGELNGALRSGSTVNALGSVSIDPRVQECQEIMAYNLATINEAIGATYKGCFSGKKLTLFSGWPSDTGHVELEPEKHFESLENVVSYAFPGADVNGVTVAVGQLVGTRLMSRKTGRGMHPMIEDADFEDGQTQTEAVTDALMQGFLVQVQQGTAPLIDAARVVELLRENKPLEKALMLANEEAQKRQASQAAPPDPAAGEVVAPGTQPGLAEPGQGVEQQPPDTVPGPVKSTENLSQLVRALTSPVSRVGRVP